MLKKLFLVAMFLILLGNLSAFSATRSFSATTINQSQTIEVSITIDGTGILVYGIDEIVPTGWTINEVTDSGGINGNKISWLFLDNNNRILKYNATAPASVGSHVFKGNSTDGTNIFAISGQTTITTTGTDATPPIISDIQSTSLETSATIEYTTNENSNSTIYYGKTISLENKQSSSSLTNTHSINLIRLENTQTYYYKLNSCDSSGNCANSSIYSFTTTQTTNITDDLMVNYVRGQIKIDGVNASQGTIYLIEILSGENTGFTYARSIDNQDIPDSLKGNGFFDTRDKIEFNTGERFKIKLNDHNCYTEGIFENGGNGNFETGQGLVNINCDSVDSPDAPIITSISNKVINENQTLEFIVYATDQDNNAITLTSSNLPSGATFTDYNNNSGKFSWTPNYNQAGTYDVIFNAIDTTALSTTKTITITVNDVERPFEFEDINICNSITPELELTIKEPDDGDEITLGEKFEGKIKIKNNADEDMDVDVEFYLYNLDEDEVEEDTDESIDVNEGDSENLKLEIKLPEDIDADDDYVVLVKAEAKEDQDYCNYKFVSVEIEKPENLVIIEDIEISPEIAYIGDYITVKIELENLGQEDEDVSIELSIDELKISQKTNIEIEEDDKETKTISIKIPENSKPGTYEIKIKVLFEDGESIESKSISIKEKSKTTPSNLTNSPISVSGSKDLTTNLINDSNIFPNSPLISLTQPKPILTNTKSSLTQPKLGLTNVKYTPKTKQTESKEKPKGELDIEIIDPEQEPQKINLVGFELGKMFFINSILGLGILILFVLIVMVKILKS